MARRDHRSEQARRDELARQRGFRSYAQQRRFSRALASEAELQALPDQASQVRAASLRVLARARTTNITIPTAAADEGIAPQAAAYWTDGAIRRSMGNYSIAPADRLLRDLWVWSDGRKAPVTVPGARQASLVGSYHAAIRHFVETGDETALQSFTGRRIAGVKLETDPEVIEAIGRRGEAGVESIYRLT